MTASNEEIYKAIGSLTTSVEALHGKLDDQHKRLNRHSDRLGKLERWRSWFLGVGTVLGSAAGAFAWIKLFK